MMSRYLPVFAFVDSLCILLGTRPYLWGGWVADVYSGRQLREHADADYLVVNLYSHRLALQSVFEVLGWEAKVLGNEDLRVSKDGLKVHFGHLEIQGETAEWFHNGRAGKIVFPAGWLSEKSIQFEGFGLHAVKLEFQYVLKRHPELMNPVWSGDSSGREKDRLDLQVLETLLAGQEVGALDQHMYARSYA